MGIKHGFRFRIILCVLIINGVKSTPCRIYNVIVFFSGGCDLSSLCVSRIKLMCPDNVTQQQAHVLCFKFWICQFAHRFQRPTNQD